MASTRRRCDHGELDKLHHYLILLLMTIRRMLFSSTRMLFSKEMKKVDFLEVHLPLLCWRVMLIM